MRRVRRVVWIGWDAADWGMIHPLLDSGRMPGLAGLAERGVIGNLATTRPWLSPLLWTSIATGKTADKHGVLGFLEPLPGGRVRRSGSGTRRTKAIWNILSQSGLRSEVLGWYATHPAERVAGGMVSDRFTDVDSAPFGAGDWEIPVGSTHPAERAGALGELRLRPSDLLPGDLSGLMPALGPGGAGLLSDAGREALLGGRARAWDLARIVARAATVQALTLEAMDRGEWEFLACYQDALDAGGHVFMPYHPPIREGVPEGDFELHRGVMEGLYVFLDETLRHILDRVDWDDTAVMLVSDHGFLHDDRRPSGADAGSSGCAAEWHRGWGVFAMAGPGVRRDERVHGATILDATPTTLALFGLPTGRDMDGRVLREAFEEGSDWCSERIGSWDDREGPHPSGWAPGGDGEGDAGEDREADAEAEAVSLRLEALGYLAPGSGELGERACAEWRFNLSQVLRSLDRSGEARSELEGLAGDFPEEARFGLALAECRAATGDALGALALLEEWEGRGVSTAGGDLVAAACLFSMGDDEAAWGRLDRAESRAPRSADRALMAAQMLRARGRWSEAREAYGRLVELDPKSAHGWEGLASGYLKGGRFREAAEAARRALGILYHFPTAHYVLGLALEGLGEGDRAIEALERALERAGDRGFPEASEAVRRLRGEVGGPGLV